MKNLDAITMFLTNTIDTLGISDLVEGLHEEWGINKTMARELSHAFIDKYGTDPMPNWEESKDFVRSFLERR